MLWNKDISINLSVDFISDRSHRVCLDIDISHAMYISSDIPQSSILNPLLFTAHIAQVYPIFFSIHIYTNDILYLTCLKSAINYVVNT